MIDEKKLEDAAIKLGEAMANAPEKVKQILRAMKNQVDQFVSNEEKTGKQFDRSALFAAGIIAHPDITDEKMIGMAKNYIDTDYLFVKIQK